MARWGRGLIWAGVMVAVLVPGQSGAQATLTDKARRDEVVRLPRNDPAMDEAFRRARATLPDFYKVLDAPGPGIRNLTVKVGLPTPRGGREYVWLSDPLRKGDQIVGTIDNTPVDTQAYRKGQQVVFPETAVVDWAYREGDRMRGNYTACALTSKFSAKERRRFEEEYGIDCSK